MFHWNVLMEKEEAMNTPVGNCQLMNMQTGQVVNYAPCRELHVDAVYARGCEDLYLKLLAVHARLVMNAVACYVAYFVDYRDHE